MPAIEMTFPLRCIVEAAVSAHGGSGWTLRDDAFWCHVDAPVPLSITQGWKLHLSATLLSAPFVLHAAAEILLDSGCPFKFAKDLARVEELTSIHYDRAQAGKFIAAYPRTDDEFHRLANALSDATTAFPGPQILSDRPYRAGSIVQYRYGAFLGVRSLNDDGAYEARLRAPDGQVVSDVRRPWFSVPSWVRPIQPTGFDGPATQTPSGTTANAGERRLFGGRFEVFEAIRHSARGGVYRATDVHSGKTVVIKQARAHIGCRRDGLDSRELLVHEAAALRELAPLTPAYIAEFTIEDNTFLVEEFIEGRPLAEHIANALSPTKAGTSQGVEQLACLLVQLVRDVHSRGWVFRDLSSMNVMVRPDGGLVLIDAEHAARPGEIVQRTYTPGFAPPEVVDSEPYGCAPEMSADAFAVGAILIHLALGSPPSFLADQNSSRTVSERIQDVLRTALVDRPLVAQWLPMLTGLTAQLPAQRWTLADAADFLSQPTEPAAHVYSASRLLPPTTTETNELTGRLLDEALEQLVWTMRPNSDWLWRADGFGSSTDPLNVQYGAAGILSVLRRAAVDRQDAGAARVLPSVAAWIRARLDSAPRLLPGLYFGRTGTAWALREAAEQLDDRALAVSAEDLGLRLPTRSPNPDVCHGIAGAGLGQLRLWQLSGHEQFLDRAVECADALSGRACEMDDGIFWPIPADADSSLAGLWHLGFAHGVAGVATFLLAAAQATGNRRYLDLAQAGGRTLAAAAEVDGQTGAAVWRTNRQDSASGVPDLRYHWCSGASGVGTFLVRLASAETDAVAAKGYWDLIHAAAVAVHRARWISPTANCHGLAGNAQFLLDAADAAVASAHSCQDAELYRDWAHDLAAVIASRRAERNGKAAIPDESGLAVTAGYSTGTAGVVDLLLRLHHGGPRSWMVQPSTVRQGSLTGSIRSPATRGGEEDEL